jgi:hypothetical protein
MCNINIKIKYNKNKGRKFLNFKLMNLLGIIFKELLLIRNYIISSTKIRNPNIKFLLENYSCNIKRYLLNIAR